MGRLFSFVLVLSMLLVGCGGSTDTNAANAPKSGDEWDADDDMSMDDDEEDDHEEVSARKAFGGMTPPEKAWSKMSFQEREFYMVGKVFPIMEEVFEEHDNKRWSKGKYECESCHGSDMKALDYKMPSKTLYAVPKRGTKAYKGMKKMFPEMVTFMEDEITPSMGKLLGHKKFTCNGCHPQS